MSASADRLERALELFVAYRTNGGDWSALLAAHAELAELLVAMRQDAGADAPAAADDPTERTVAVDGDLLGDYRLGRVIGQGGIGTVHEARDRLLGRRVAVKVLRPEFAANVTSLARFRREAQTLARLDHPEIVRVLGVGDTGGRHWLAMEFVDGESLAARIERLRADGGHSGDSLRNLVHAIAAVATALQHTHEAGIVHRDVKPSNVLLRPDGTPVLMDFGIARDRDDPALTSTGATMGSPRYMAPEQVLHGGTACNERSDVFSLGSTLYECITLQPAFPGATVEASLSAVVHTDPIDPRRLQRGVPADLAAIVTKALEKDPARRYQSARAFAADLRAFLELREITARPPSRSRRWIRRLRQRPAVAALVVTAVVAVVALAWIGVQWPSLRAAAAALRQRQYDEAVVRGFLARGEGDAERRAFEAAIAIDPSRTEAVLGLVFATSRSHGPEAALAELDTRTGDATDESVGRCRAWLLDRLQRTGEAESLRRSLGPATSTMELWLEGISCLAANDTDPVAVARARELLSLAVRIAPRPNLLLHAQWAALVRKGGTPAERVEAAEALLRLWPERSFAVGIAGGLLVLADPQRAETALRRALELGADDPTVLANLGAALARRGDSAGAVAMLESALEHPRIGASLRATVLSGLSQVDASAADRFAEHSLRSAPDDPVVQRFAGRAAFRRGDPERAIALLRTAVAGSGADFDTRLDLAFTLVNGGAPGEAATMLLDMVRTRPDHEHLHLQLLDAFDQLEDHDAALEELRRWAEARPLDAAAWREFAAASSRAPTPSPGDRDLVAAERAFVLSNGTDDAVRELYAGALERRGESAAAARVRTRPVLRTR